MSLKVWTIWNSYGSHGEDKVQGPDIWNTEVVEKAEYDKLRGALEAIASQGPEAYLGVEWKHWKTIAREALDASTPSS
jgi:hypothetical protein